MNADLGPRWAVITGVSKGIGRALALRLGREGVGIIGCARGQDGLDALAQEWKMIYPMVPLHVMVADLGNIHDVLAFGRWVLSLTPHSDLLIHNAGIFKPGKILDIQEGGLESMLQINVLSVYHLTRQLVPSMVARGKGHVFTLCSVASFQAYPGGSDYSISKFALLGLTRSLRSETKDTGVKVTALLPGATWSDSWAGVDLPRTRLMEPEDLAEIVWTTFSLGPSAVVEEILLRPQLGDL